MSRRSQDAPDGGLDGDPTGPTGPVPQSPEVARTAAPPSLRLAAGLTLAQGLGTAAFAITEILNIHSDRVAMGAAVAVFFLAYGALLVVAAWALATVRSWARGPVLLAQLIWLGLAWNLRTGSAVAVAAVLAVVAALTLACLLHPRSVDAVERAAGRR